LGAQLADKQRVGVAKWDHYTLFLVSGSDGGQGTQRARARRKTSAPLKHVQGTPTTRGIPTTKVAGCQYTVRCSTSSWTIWGGGHRCVVGCDDASHAAATRHAWQVPPGQFTRDMLDVHSPPAHCLVGVLTAPHAAPPPSSSTPPPMLVSGVCCVCVCVCVYGEREREREW
jgi:hypothetical protein